MATCWWIMPPLIGPTPPYLTLVSSLILKQFALKTHRVAYIYIDEQEYCGSYINFIDSYQQLIDEVRMMFP